VDRRHREPRREPDRRHRRDAPGHHVGTPGPGHRLRRGRIDGEEEAGGLFLMAPTPVQPKSGSVEAYLAAHDSKDLLRFITCGSVDDGKSTLIGRLLFDSQLLPDDQIAELRRDSRNRIPGPEGIDFSLLVDGLMAEREQGITIDVAYRFFESARRRYIVADTPGHEQYTRNMVT